ALHAGELTRLRRQAVRRREFRVLAERRARAANVSDALVCQHLLRRVAEAVLPDDVARDQTLGRGHEQRAGLGGREVLPGDNLPERVRDPDDAAVAVLERVDEPRVLVAQSTRRVDRARGGDVLLLITRAAPQISVPVCRLPAAEA